MIQRIKLIGNVGQFVEAKGGRDDLRFEPLTLIYAENARGKTMLAAAFRSLAMNDPDYLRERKCLWGRGEIQVAMDTARGTAVFQNDTWTNPGVPVHVFDEHFVDTNVCSHRAVTVEHRRGLHRIVLGEDNVALAERVADLTEEIKGITREISDAGKELQPHIAGTMTPSDFCSLPVINDVDAQIAAQEQSLAAARAATTIRLRPGRGAHPSSQRD